MKKISVTLIETVLILLLCACGNKGTKPENTSDKMYDIGLSALETTNEYLDNTIDLDSAREQIESSLRASDRQIELDKEEVGDTLYGTEYSNDWFIHSKILLINSELIQKQNGTGTNRAIEELKDDLAEFLNE